MAGLGLLVLVLLAVLGIGGYYLWTRRPAPVDRAGNGHGRHSNVPLLTEAVAYVGAILLLAGGIAAIGQHWSDISDWGHVALLGGGAALFLIAGAVLREAADAAIARVVSVVWFVSVGGVAAAVALATHDVYRNSGITTVLVTGLATTAYAGALWLLRRRALQNAALLGSLIVTVCGVIVVSVDSPTGLMFALSLWALGVAWAALGWRRVTEPRWVSGALGIVLALLAPSLGVGDHGWLFAVAIVTAGTLMALSVPLHNTPLLGLATVTMFAYLTSMLVRYFRESLGVPAALALAGLLILVLAVVSARLMRATRAPNDGVDLPRTADEGADEERPKQLHHV